MSRKFIPVVLVFTLLGFLFVNQSKGSPEREPKTRYERILRNVGILLEEGHYAPKKLDDAFSRQVLQSFLKDLDPDRNIFLAADIKSFEVFNTRLDDEIKGEELKSFYAINKLYIQRQKEVSAFYKDFLTKPFNFLVDETVQMDRDSAAYPRNEAERKEIWRKQIKYMVLDRFVSMQEEQAKKKGESDFKPKADSTLEREARESVNKNLGRMFTIKINHENDDENFSTFVNAITTTMDPHTSYLPPVDLRSFNESIRGSFFGIGAQLREEDGKIKIGPLQAGMPAQKSGEVKEGDEIIKVGQGEAEPVDVTGYSVTDAVKLIRGENGTIVKLTLRKLDGNIKVVPLKRAKIDLDLTFARSAVINGEKRIGYIYLPEFYADFEDPNGARSYRDVAKEVEKLKQERVDGIVIDLRGNGGGSLNDVVQMVGLFIPDGPIVQVRTRGDQTNVLRDRDSRVQYDGPLAVMIDETSASASEIFAAAIQDYGRGVVIGSTSSYGKGTVQRNIPLNPQNESIFSQKKDADDLGTVKLTLQKFYRINGGSTQQKGVVPDIIVPDRYELMKFREKDTPNSLAWDKINKASYSPWVSTYSLPEVIREGQKIIASDSIFKGIRREVAWISDNARKEKSLNINKYKQSQKEFTAAYKQLDSLYKLNSPMNVTATTADFEVFKTNTDKLNKSTDFINRIKNDIYIRSTARIMDHMINPSNTATASEIRQ